MNTEILPAHTPELFQKAVRCAAELLPVLFLRELDMHQLMFALGETIAHLNHLVQRGRAQRRVSGDGVIRFVSLH